MVVAVVLGNEREKLRSVLQKIELTSGKGRKKWTKATRKQKLAYAEGVLPGSEFRGKLFFTPFRQRTDYLECLLEAVARAITTAVHGTAYQATVLIDGLGKTERHRVSAGLRRMRIAAKKVRGLRDESDEFIRLADATAGLIREHLDDHDWAAVKILEEALAKKVVREV